MKQMLSHALEHRGSIPDLSMGPCTTFPCVGPPLPRASNCCYTLWSTEALEHRGSIPDLIKWLSVKKFAHIFKRH